MLSHFKNYASADDLYNDVNITVGYMLKAYNQLSGQSVKKFSSRKDGARRLWAEFMKVAPPAVVEQVADFDEIPSGIKGVKAYKPNKAMQEQVKGDLLKVGIDVDKLNAEAPKEKGKPGRKGEFAGKVLIPLCKGNPRKIGTDGHASYEIIRDKPEGVPYEAYRAAGGRPQDIRWDISKGWLEVR